MTRQPTLPFEPEPAHRCRPVLVTAAQAAIVLKLKPEPLLEMVECGDFIWVFDLARPGAKRRELRFWVGELLRRQAGLLPEHRTPVQAVEQIVGHETVATLRTGTVAEILWTTRTVVHAWLAAKELDGPDPASHQQTVWRSSLVHFLLRRRYL